MNFKLLTCSIFGHPRVITGFWGYENCARCGTELGDSLEGIGLNKKDLVLKGHNCDKCKENYRKLKWHEKLFIGNVWEG